MASLSKTTKMPGPSWGISASLCPVGSKLAQRPGTVCYECYALRGHYHMGTVKRAQYARLREYYQDQGRWVDRMIDRIEPYRWFRWFDSGDLQSETMLQHIFYVCEATPYTAHYLPTKQVEFVREVVRRKHVPENLCIRLSAYYFDRMPPWADGRAMVDGVCGSTATTIWAQRPIGQRCPAPDQGGKCVTCRACWDPTVPLVSYDRKHQYVGGKHRRKN